ncbi:MAG: hypothetical protein ACI3Y2_01455 [Candidatus Egerieousia sp.]
MEKTKIEFIAKITTPDGKEILKRVEEEIPSLEEYNQSDLDEFMSSFDEYERHTLKARNSVCEEITKAWFEEQAKKGV